MLNDSRFANYNSYIMTSYVDYIQAQGARVVPLIVNETMEVSFEKLKKLNGVVMPGGDGDYQDYGGFLYEYIKQFNDEGTYYPLWGICMGYENMVGY
jgi:anthranilate/para-aminobenzoate synthase component II